MSEFGTLQEERQESRWSLREYLLNEWISE